MRTAFTKLRLYLAGRLDVSRGTEPGPAWRLFGYPGLIHARTRSEARAAFKRRLNLRRIPAGLTPVPA